MPELPEVQTYKVYIDSTSLHQKITDVDCRDERLLKKPLSDFREYLIDQEFTESRRIGKYLFLKTTGDRVVVMHFGMTGRPDYYKAEEDRPKYGHIQISFGSGFHFSFINKRKFGWLDLAEDVDAYKNEIGLSDDARELKLDDFLASFKNRKSYIKPILMDQSVAAGVGNWMADEILFQARIHPKSKVTDMDEADLKSIYQSMQHVIEVAIKHDAHYDDFPSEFLIHNRKDGGICPQTNCEIEKIKVGGRTTYFSPEWQELK